MFPLIDRGELVLALAMMLVVGSSAYAATLFVLSRWSPPRPRTSRSSQEQPHVVFLMPCLNEEAVIAASLHRILAVPYARLSVVVIDDGSDDATADIVHSFQDDRLHLLPRQLPNARQGKGEALNAAVRYLQSGAVVPLQAPDEVVVVVMDADGRLEEHTLQKVLPMFGDPAVGAVQIGVRINNRHRNVLARMQDVEFLLYTQVFQRARRHLGSVGLGGNGQFVRLSALTSLGVAPWSRSLAEDLDLGVRLLVRGWHTDFCPEVAVHQQGLVTLHAWLRQRARWFQGHLQSWARVPDVLRSLTGRARADLLYHLTSPYLLLVASLLTVAFILWVLELVLRGLVGEVNASWWWLSSYLFAFGPALLLGTAYWREERNEGYGLPRAVLLMHTYVAYALLWYAAGWIAVVRTLRGRTGWAKTGRLAEEVSQSTDIAVTEQISP